MSRYAKYIGGALGWALGGPIGAIMGYAFGSMVADKSLSMEGGPQQRSMPGGGPRQRLVGMPRRWPLVRPQPEQLPRDEVAA